RARPAGVPGGTPAHVSRGCRRASPLVRYAPDALRPARGAAPEGGSTRARRCHGGCAAGLPVPDVDTERRAERISHRSALPGGHRDHLALRGVTAIANVLPAVQPDAG